jgi:lipoprotein-releasing system permease protein
MPKFNAPLFIAKRYFVANPEKNRLLFNLGFIKILSGISVLAVCLGTASLTIVLSVFNGMEGLTKQLFRQHNSEIRISPAQGKSFVLDSALRTALQGVPGIQVITEVIEDNALLRYDEGQLVVKVKGVSQNFAAQYQQFDTAVVMGKAELVSAEGYPQALLGMGVYYHLNVQLGNRMKALQFWYPKRGKTNLTNPMASFQRQSILPGGVLSIEQQFDISYVLVPLDFMKTLVDYEHERSYLEVRPALGTDRQALQAQLQQVLGQQFMVQTSEELQSNILRAVKIEKLFVFMAFLFLIALASFNIFASLIILALEKRTDIAILKAQGASDHFVFKLFLYEGLLIGGVGTGIGLFLGFSLCFVQQQFGLISMGVESAITMAYPVEIHWPDFVLSGAVILAITLLSAWWPARKAARTELSAYL